MKSLKARRRRVMDKIKRGFYKTKIQETMARNSLYRGELKQKATPAEILFEEWLKEQNIRYMFQKGFLKPFHRIVDFYIPKTRTIIEIDGGYHSYIEDKDNKKDLIWSKKGYKTIRIRNEEVYNNNFKLDLDILSLLSNFK